MIDDLSTLNQMLFFPLLSLSNLIVGIETCEDPFYVFYHMVSFSVHSKTVIVPNSCKNSAGSIVKSEPLDHAWTPDREKAAKNGVEFTRPDALLASDWQDRSSGIVEDTTNVTDAISLLLGDDLAADYEHLPTGISTSHLGWGLDSCSWNNMPAVCHMSDLP